MRNHTGFSQTPCAKEAPICRYWPMPSEAEALVGMFDRPGRQTVFPAGVAELVDAPDLGSGVREDVGVQVPSPAPQSEEMVND